MSDPTSQDDEPPEETPEEATQSAQPTIPEDAVPAAEPVETADDFHGGEPETWSGPEPEADPAAEEPAADSLDETGSPEPALEDAADESPAEEEPVAERVEPEPEPEPEPPLVILPPPGPAPRRQRPAGPGPVRRPGVLGRLVRRVIVLGLLIGVVLPLSATLFYKFVGPPITLLMVQRVFEGRGLDRRWVSLSRMSPALPNAVIAAEDARYCSHYGFDFEAMEKALANNQRRPGKVRGGSTISQQTAKNVFLWPQRSYLRKGLEAYFTVLIETLWGKRRIMEVYLNTIEWGPGVYGADAAARRYFGVGADKLSSTQASRLAAILPSPLKWKAAKPGPYVRKRSRRIGAASGTVRREGLAACVR